MAPDKQAHHPNLTVAVLILIIAPDALIVVAIAVDAFIFSVNTA